MTAPLPADGGAVDAAVFRAVLGRFATGVSIMTTSRDGIPHGMTANAVSSVSLDPPLVLVCVERETVMAADVRASRAFALSILHAGQAPLSDFFADPDRPIGHEQFAGVALRTGATGSPILEEGLGWIDCRVWEVYGGGDHLIVVGEVVDLGVGSSDDPLLYYRSGYVHLEG